MKYLIRLTEDDLVLGFGTTLISNVKHVILDKSIDEFDEENNFINSTDTGLVPDEFEESFKSYFYKFDGEKIVINENYVEPTLPDEDEQPSPVEVLGQQVAILTIDNANLKNQNEALGKQTATLTLENAGIKEQNKILGQSLTELKLEVAKMKGGKE